jgi:hypothetical protein
VGTKTCCATQIEAIVHPFEDNTCIYWKIYSKLSSNKNNEFLSALTNINEKLYVMEKAIKPVGRKSNVDTTMAKKMNFQPSH